MKGFDDVLHAISDLPATKGGWTTAQHLDHCAASISASVDGYPKLKPAIIRGTIGKLVKRRFLSRGSMSHDTSAPLPGGPLPADLGFMAARAALIGAIDRFRRHTGAYKPHPVYGVCSAADYEALHVMHIADHLRTVRG